MRGTATDKLADVMQMLLLVQKTGILTVQRENLDKSIEEGSLFLRDGQIADALVGNIRGADALKKLSTWTQCYFVFQASSPTASSPLALQTPPAATFAPLPAQQSWPGDFALIPCRADQFQHTLPDFERLRLSRLHRQLFLLVDGQRSIDTLAKLLKRYPQEVLSMFSELEYFHLLRRP
ncbi:MAG TPA: DUF4388 domain-containing protein [Ktedonobacteraceae bacterium]